MRCKVNLSTRSCWGREKEGSSHLYCLTDIFSPLWISFCSPPPQTSGCFLLYTLLGEEAWIVKCLKEMKGKSGNRWKHKGLQLLPPLDKDNCARQSHVIKLHHCVRMTHSLLYWFYVLFQPLGSGWVMVTEKGTWSIPCFFFFSRAFKVTLKSRRPVRRKKSWVPHPPNSLAA